MNPAQTPLTDRTKGPFYALAAYGSWGVFPIYFKALKSVSPAVVLCHRVVWSALVMALIVGLSGGLRPFWQALRSTRVRLMLLATTTLIACNWLLYIWAVVSGHILEASLGYFINPLVNVTLGGLFLREKLTTRQRIAVGLALCGVVVLTVGSGVVPWISLVLAGTFAFYGLLRKKVAIDAAGGLLAETLFLVVPAIGFLFFVGDPWASSAMGWKGTSLLVAAGPITALPLLWFANAARRLPLAVLGFFQYLSPTLQFLVAVVIYGEAFRPIHGLTFAFIWAGVALFLVDAFARARQTHRDATALR